MSIDDQPVNVIEWVHRDKLHANHWNPNVVPPPELKLLAISILEDGWTQPLVIDDELQIIDGYHRWTVSGYPAVSALTDGMVPCVRLNTDAAHQRISTVRHNRARGVHHVVRMADIVADLTEMGMEPEDIKTRLRMDKDEVQRLLDRGKMNVRGVNPNGVGRAWEPTAKE